ncbi:MAG: sigma-54-dependent Fis family transcriptional regulator, partial [Proteobacteria bacterium]
MYRILLVEDAETLREVITSLLKNDGFEVHEFAEAEPALEELRRSSYDCVLSDFRLPKMDGIEFLKGVREVAPRVPFLIMTAYGSIEIAVEAMKHGANDFICKPFEPDKLSAVLRQVIEHKRIIDRSIG